MPKISDVTGVILAGGKSSRFGSNKAFALFKGRPLIEGILEVIGSVFGEILLATNTPEVYTHLQLCQKTGPLTGPLIIQDEEPDQGPLGGIFAAFRHTTNSRIFVVGCDMPLLDPAVIRQIVAVEDEIEAVIPWVKHPHHHGEPQYLMALYSRHVLPHVCHCLKTGKLSMKEFCTQLTQVRWFPVEGDSCLSVNRPEDLKLLEERHAD
ncbi:MAG: molybdenum cofactor guanylyltransferase [Deltaproteobacteria bacterium]|nr:molybdenum cofactor guanylyltransferase [Deltaproteobacteria bacterium]